MNIEKVGRVKAHQKYHLADGTLVPGVTTVLGVLAKGALIPWANKLGLAGIEIAKYVDQLAAVGTCAHYLILCHIKNEPPYLDDYTKEQIDLAENSFLKYLEWEKGRLIKVVAVELQLVSEAYKFGGTIDAIVEIDGRLQVVDYKTSKAIYADHFHQVGAYTVLATEHGYDVVGARILQIGRSEDEGFSEQYKTVPELALHREIFLHSLEIYKAQRKLKV